MDESGSDMPVTSGMFRGAYPSVLWDVKRSGRKSSGRHGRAPLSSSIVARHSMHRRAADAVGGER